MKKILMLILSSWAVLSSQAACPSWPSAERFLINGEEVTDLRTGLVWKRCSEGQVLNGNSCMGSDTRHTHEQALVRAKSANIAGSVTGWRLPNVKELASLADKGCQNPAIDTVALPGTPSSYYWSSSPVVGSGGLAWSVLFSSGLVYWNPRIDDYLAIRLVRSSNQAGLPSETGSTDNGGGGGGGGNDGIR